LIILLHCPEKPEEVADVERYCRLILVGLQRLLGDIAIMMGSLLHLVTGGLTGMGAPQAKNITVF